MILNTELDFSKIIEIFDQGQIFAYPTEAVYGIGGDPSNPNTIEYICNLKQGRNINKGMIIVASQWDHCNGWIDQLSEQDKISINHLFDEYPTTVILNAGQKLAKNIFHHQSKKIALRISKHPTIVALCDLLQQPIISTSANFSGKKPASSLSEVYSYFPNIPIIEGKLGIASKPSRIIDWQTQKIIRS